MDETLRELERAVFAAPSDGAARISLARGLARVGRRADAIEAFHKARVLGAALDEVRVGLRGLGAPASPWGHTEVADSRNSRASPLTGPRRGEVVASTTGEIQPLLVLDEQGDILCDTGFHATRRLVVFDGVTLGARADSLRRGMAPDFALAGSAIVLSSGTGFSYRLAATSRDGSARFLLSGELGSFVRSRVTGGRLREGGLSSPCVSAEGDVLVVEGRGQATIFSSALQPSASFSCGRYARLPCCHGDRLAVLGGNRHFGVAESLRVLERSGELVFERPLVPGATYAPACDERGVVHVVAGHLSSWRLLAFAPDGAEAWSLDLGDGGGSISPLIALADEACYVFSSYRLLRVEQGRVAWTFDAASTLYRPVVDRHGVVYAGFGDTGVVAVGPDGRVVFERRDGKYEPLAIDGHGRLLARRTRWRETPELVAIA